MGSVGLVGANGAGKTTLFRLMLGHLEPLDGALDVLGRPVATDPMGVRARLGYMPEHDALPSDQTAADFVASFGEIAGLSPRSARQRASDVLDLVGLDEARFRPLGGFSTGMRQRAKLAQALVAGPELVLLDEPTAGMDPRGRDEMLGLIERLGTFDMSVLFATHLLDDVQQVCRQVVMLDAGYLVRAGPVDELVRQTGVVRVEVGGRDSDAARALVNELAHYGVAAQAVDQATVDVVAAADDSRVVDVVRDAVAELGLRLYSLAPQRRSLDDIFVEGADR